MTKKFSFPKIYPITNLAMSGFLKHYQVVELLCKSGAKIIQMRPSDYNSWEWYYDAVIAAKTAKKYKAALIINNRADIARAVGAEGLHLGKEDIPPHAARELVGSDALVGFSTRSLEEAKMADENPSVDYIAIGPVFETTTKKTGIEPLGLGMVTKIKTVITKPLVAIGGINVERAPEVLRAGADSVACISSIMKGNVSVNFESHMDAVKDFINT